jgi:hypothetical protein
MNLSPSRRYVAVAVAVVLAAIGIWLFLYKRDVEKGKVLRMRSQVRLNSENDALRISQTELQEEVKRKRHSEEELKVMLEALEAVSKSRQDELREVMIPSAEIKILRVLGKGG